MPTAQNSILDNDEVDCAASASLRFQVADFFCMRPAAWVVVAAMDVAAATVVVAALAVVAATAAAAAVVVRAVVAMVVVVAVVGATTKGPSMMGAAQKMSPSLYPAELLVSTTVPLFAEENCIQAASLYARAGSLAKTSLPK
eukprot:5622340-Amphidinium_carterae.1